MIETFYGSLKDIFQMTWPMLCVSMILAISFRISYLLKTGERIVIYKEITTFFFAFYILCLFQIVTSQDINIYSGNNFIPFQEILRYDFGSRLFVRNIVGNVVMFIPYGYFLTYYLNEKNPLIYYFFIVLASLSIELTQLSIGRVFDVDDIILNVLGGIIGHFVFKLFNRIFKKMPKIFKSELFLNVLSIILLVVFIIILILFLL